MKTHMIYIDALKEEVEFNVGENAADNDAIIDNASADNLLRATTKCGERLNSVVTEGKRRSLWFHVGGGRSSCHVVAVIPDGTNKKNVKYIVTQGAVLCKKFSRYASEKDLEIIYTLLENVTKTDVAGKVEVSMYKTKII